MENRRSFLKKAGILAGTFGVLQHLPKSIEAALAINPIEGSTFLDAEHIVMLMQENRSFDHSFGTLRGVRGFNDRLVMHLPNGYPVWLQSNKEGKTYAPFRMDIKNSKASWTEDLPHSWENQIGAWNEGKFDKWLDWKCSGNKNYRDIPLTLGYYTREDIPFYYAFADAFTICDQHFCSSITGTTTNRHYFWTGKCVETPDSKPLVRNSDTYYTKMMNWKTFPERLQEQGISWKVYQNEISLQNEISGKTENLLGNFTDNNLEWFEQYNVRFKKSHIDFYNKRLSELPVEIKELEAQLKIKHDQKLQNTLKQKKAQLESFQKEVDTYSAVNYDKLSDFEKELHERAFQTNEHDPNYHEVVEIDFEGSKIKVPKGDVLHQFRTDVDTGNLPTVSWLCAPQVFSDHPSAPMYGAWYVSEILNILTKNPEVWKKTIFILNYDENDGYFDHIPPFVAPKPNDPKSGKVSSDLIKNIQTEFVTKEQEQASGVNENAATEGPVGLGYRVPLIIASPWSKGGWVNSEVFDITSTIQFVEKFVAHKFQKDVTETNISPWRRAITGDLTSVFRNYDPKEELELPAFLDMKSQIKSIDSAKDKVVPDGYHLFSSEEIANIRQGEPNRYLPKQEAGTKPSNAIWYELDVTEKHSLSQIELIFSASNKRFGNKSLSGVFTVYDRINQERFSKSFSVSAGQELSYFWDKKEGAYDLEVFGPNGFYRQFKSEMKQEKMTLSTSLAIAGDDILLHLKNTTKQAYELTIYNAYTKETRKLTLNAGRSYHTDIENSKFGRWYDLTIQTGTWKRRLAGRTENGKPSISDPLMA